MLHPASQWYARYVPKASHTFLLRCSFMKTKQMFFYLFSTKQNYTFSLIHTLFIREERRKEVKEKRAKQNSKKKIKGN